MTFNRPKTVPYFTHSWVLCNYRLLTHCAFVSLKIIFFKITQQIAQGPHSKFPSGGGGGGLKDKQVSRGVTSK